MFKVAASQINVEMKENLTDKAPSQKMKTTECQPYEVPSQMMKMTECRAYDPLPNKP